jgi:raffinose/stachyose/melibiose transport system substrate-binding protein
MALRFFELLGRWLGPVFVVGAFAWSCVFISTHRQAANPPGSLVLHIAHWQLEAGVRDGLAEMADAYRQAAPDHANIVIVQDAIPLTTYGQWVSSQLIGNTAPDIVEVGNGLSDAVWLSYLNRYFVPLTDVVDRPNPYNAGNNLADVPLRQTYIDGMRGGYVDELQEYIKFPLTHFTDRIFFNRDLLFRLTGLREPPKEYRAFLDCCRKIAAAKDSRGQNYIPIACSRYHLNIIWAPEFFDPLTYDALPYTDLKRDGVVGIDEQYAATRVGWMNMRFPAIRARFKMLAEMIPFFQQGYLGLNRDEAVFPFAQQRAVFITTGSWDVASLIEQARGQFDVGICDFPWPSTHDPEFGAFFHAPTYESTPSDKFAFSVTRTGHVQQAMDFLLFCASRENNARLNRAVHWMPVIRGAPIEPDMRPFIPRVFGQFPAFSPLLGGDINTRFDHDYTAFQAAVAQSPDNFDAAYDDFVRDFDEFYIQNGYAQFQEQQRDWQRGSNATEQTLAAMRGNALLDDPSGQGSQWVRYRTMSIARQMLAVLPQSRELNLIEHGPGPADHPPYRYSNYALARLHLAPTPTTAP